MNLTFFWTPKFSHITKSGSIAFSAIIHLFLNRLFSIYLDLQQGKILNNVCTPKTGFSNLYKAL